MKFLNNIKLFDKNNIRAGQICLANSAMVAETSATPVELDGAIGLVKDSEALGIREFIAPAIAVGMSASHTYQYRYFDREFSFPKAKKMSDIVRGFGGEFAYEGSTDGLRAGALLNIGLSIALEKHRIEADPAYRTRNAVRLNNIIQTALTLDAAEKFEAGAESKSNTITVSTETGDILTKLRGWLLDAAAKSGMMPNRMIVGARAWQRIKGYAAGKNVAGAFAFPKTVAELGTELGVDAMEVRAYYNNGGASLAEFFSDKILFFYGESGLNEFDLSSMKSFVGTTVPKFTTWEHPQGEIEVLTYSYWGNTAMTCERGTMIVTVNA